MDYEKWMQKARESIQTELSHDRVFELKSLFKECEWETLEKGERISFGKYFANEVREGRIDGVKRVERGKNNHTQYIKIN